MDVRNGIGPGLAAAALFSAAVASAAASSADFMERIAMTDSGPEHIAIEEVIVTAPRLPGVIIEEVEALSEFSGQIARPEIRLALRAEG